MNDVTSNGEMVVGSELKLLEARLEFRGPWEGDSERLKGWVEWFGWEACEAMLSAEVDKLEEDEES